MAVHEGDRGLPRTLQRMESSPTNRVHPCSAQRQPTEIGTAGGLALVRGHIGRRVRLTHCFSVAASYCCSPCNTKANSCLFCGKPPPIPWRYAGEVVRWGGGGRPGQHVEGWSTWASRTLKRGEACGGRPECGVEWAAETIKRPPPQPAKPQNAKYWAPLTRKRH